MINHLEERIKKLIIETRGFTSEIHEKATLKEDLGFDSLMMVSLIVSIEETFRIEIGDDDLDPEKLKTVKDLTEIVKKYL